MGQIALSNTVHFRTLFHDLRHIVLNTIYYTICTRPPIMMLNVIRGHILKVKVVVRCSCVEGGGNSIAEIFIHFSFTVY